MVISTEMWNNFCILLKERFHNKILTTEDSVRYLFFYVLTKYDEFNPNHIILEYPFKDRKKLDTVIENNNSKIAFEFKFHRTNSSSDPKTMNAGNLFSDFFRLKRFKYSHEGFRCFSIYITDTVMQNYFKNTNHIIKKWYIACDEIYLSENDFRKMPKTFLKRTNEITSCKAKIVTKKQIDKEYLLIVTEIL